MIILITGVAGFIGSNLSDYLLSKNQIIVGVDNFDAEKHSDRLYNFLESLG